MFFERERRLLVEEGVAVVAEGLAADAAELVQLLVAVEDFGGGDALQFVFEGGPAVELGEPELAGGVVGEGEAEASFCVVEGGEVVALALVEQVDVADRAGADDLGDLALDDLSGARFGGLFGDGDAFAGFDEFADVAFGGVVGDAAHGHAVAFGEGDADEWGGDLGVFLKDLVKVAEAKKQNDVIREVVPDGGVLFHHGRHALMVTGCGGGGQAVRGALALTPGLDS